MREVTDAFLLPVAEVSAGLIGLFLIGVFVYVETGDRRPDRSAGVVDGYFRASTRIVLVLYTLPIGLSLALVIMEPVWSRGLFVVLSLVLVAANVFSAARVRAVARLFGSPVLLVTEVLGSVAVAAIVTVPWILGGLHPTRTDLTWSILLSFSTGLLSIYAMTMSTFDTTPYRTARAGGGDDEVDHAGGEVSQKRLSPRAVGAGASSPPTTR